VLFGSQTSSTPPLALRKRSSLRPFPCSPDRGVAVRPLAARAQQSWPPCGRAAVHPPAHRRFDIRHVIGGVLAFIAVTSCGYAVSQESKPEVTSHSAGPLHSGSPEGNAAASPSGPSSAPVDDVKASLWSVSTLPHKGGWAWRFHVEGRLCCRACRPFSRGLCDWRHRFGFCRAAVCRWTCDGCAGVEWTSPGLRCPEAAPAVAHHVSRAAGLDAPAAFPGAMRGRGRSVGYTR
jgi:hypothetical protein